MTLEYNLCKRLGATRCCCAMTQLTTELKVTSDRTETFTLMTYNPLTSDLSGWMIRTRPLPYRAGPVSPLGQANKIAAPLRRSVQALRKHTAGPHTAALAHSEYVHLHSSVYFTMAAPKKVCIVGSGNW